METYMLEAVGDIDGLISRAQGADEPVVLLDGDDECLVAMRPSVFERILFDSDLLNCESRDTMHL